MGRKGAFAVEHLSHSEQETEQLGEQVARRLPRGTVIAYTGELGMGKTAFTVRIDFRRGAQHDGWRVITITGVDGL
mgnify:CR=1 FL=1